MACILYIILGRANQKNVAGLVSEELFLPSLLAIYFISQ